MSCRHLVQKEAASSVYIWQSCLAFVGQVLVRRGSHALLFSIPSQGAIFPLMLWPHDTFRESIYVSMLPHTMLLQCCTSKQQNKLWKGQFCITFTSRLTLTSCFERRCMFLWVTNRIEIWCSCSLCVSAVLYSLYLYNAHMISSFSLNHFIEIAILG